MLLSCSRDSFVKWSVTSSTHTVGRQAFSFTIRTTCMFVSSTVSMIILISCESVMQLFISMCVCVCVYTCNPIEKSSEKICIGGKFCNNHIGKFSVLMTLLIYVCVYIYI